MTYRILLAMLALALAFSSAQAQTALTAAQQADLDAWNAFCEQLKQNGARVIGAHPQSHEIDRGEGLMYLAQQLSIAVDETLYSRDQALPLLRLGATTIRKGGLDGADAKYIQASLVSDGVYRLRGKLGNPALIALQVSQTAPQYVAFASLANAELEPDANGNIALMIARERPPGWSGPWLPMDPAVDKLYIREYFNDWETEQPSRYTLERVDANTAPAPLNLTGARQLLGGINSEFATRTSLWATMAEGARKGLVNQLRQNPPSDQALKNNIYGQGWFKLKPDQALLIELEKPDALMWSFQLGNFWWESLDYINATGSLNGRQAVAGSDGRYRLIISAKDPGVPNWLDTSGHPEGMIMFRYQNAKTSPTPTMKLVSFNQLGELLPKDTARITPAQRQAELDSRRRHAGLRWMP
jgi:hypothetical protein